jgi:hypothetical protein
MFKIKKLYSAKERLQMDIQKIPKKDISLIWLWLVIVFILIITQHGSHKPALASDQEYKVMQLMNEPIIEDYTSEIDDFHFGDRLRISQLDTERLYKRARAIACQEGYYKHGSLAQRNNNPGNLKKSGYPKDKYGHSIFENSTQGWLELYALLNKYNHLTLDQMNKFYATDKNWANGVKGCMQRMLEREAKKQ